MKFRLHKETLAKLQDSAVSTVAGGDWTLENMHTCQGGPTSCNIYYGCGTDQSGLDTAKYTSQCP
jgi:hypothetical protein